MGVTASQPRLTVGQRKAVEMFIRGGCVRRPNPERLQEERATYKKGWEVRINFPNQPAAIKAAETLLQLGLRAGKPNQKSDTMWILPLYGRDVVETFMSWVDLSDPTETLTTLRTGQD